MHYKDGTEAKVGDLVKGTAYNTKNADGTPRVLVGVMLQITPGASSCNCVVGFVEHSAVTPDAMRTLADMHLWHVVGGVSLNDGACRVVGKYDYSECKAFELVHRP